MHQQVGCGYPQGILNLKKQAGCPGLMGMALENPPATSKVPVRFVVQLPGADKFVLASHV